MSSLTAGGTDWITKTITQIRLDFGTSSSDTIEVDWVTIGSIVPVAYSAAIEVQAQSINGLEAQYTVKIDNNGHVSGYGLASTVVNGTPTATFQVNADAFVITDPGASATDVVPFSVISGVTYIDTALIRDGTITTAKIGNAQITNALISTLSATKLTAGTIDASNINISGTSSSALNISSASSGARTVYTSTGIEIYDASGIRVKLGAL